ncbi:hypothetical protein KAFR_0H00240 [Kazachstania africana CBS 2517]|uniref:Major facilitator superfamily (MFS) profile domain-containing protein n=1 Tax=Kazachstania africana (strain ATCC 22294 / BCRC 22015 / CBS 2517 / CECT 1963 / NBRC 1671 / NRRL Y-8276) TaxID=1071382 RepID=H2AYM7_KAZAF|nr:hypothetical protein KAFR_0H00240 [Kazachstania africana CBS 2517]CCF59433.1 hypothetical protein KAFR_0H00240 [Kazachstania africana CBS 2517]
MSTHIATNDDPSSINTSMEKNYIELKNTKVSSSDGEHKDTEAYTLQDGSIEPDHEDYQEEGYEIPTQDEMKTLRRVGGRIPFRCFLVALVELAERFSYYGLSAPFQNYMQNGPTDSPPGVLQLNSSGATGLSYFFQFWCYITPIFGGYLADTKWGRYNTIGVGTVIYIIGIFILFITSFKTVAGRDGALAGFILALILIGFATGLIKSNLSVLIADQIPAKRPRVKTLKSGERVIEDHDVTIQNVFMFFYLMINIGSLSVIATTELELNVGFWAAYLLPFCFFWIAVIVIVAGKRQYIIKPTGDRVIAKSFKVCWILCKNKFDITSAKPSYHPESEFPWEDKFVDEIQRALAACKVFLFYPIYWTCYGQMVNNFITMGSMMQLHGLPNDIFQAINSISLIIFIPICEKFLYPFIRRFTPLRPVTRIFCGFIFAAMAMVWSCVLQHFIYSTGPNYNRPLELGANDIHVGWQVPAYVFIAFSEIFASITGLEYAYSKAPANMKSFIMALFLFMNAFGSAIGCALSPVSKDPDYTWLYGSLAVACFLSGLIFWLCFRKYNKIEDEMNALDFTDSEEDEILIRRAEDEDVASLKA